MSAAISVSVSVCVETLGEARSQTSPSIAKFEALFLLLARLHLIFLTLLRLTLRVLAWLSQATLRGLSILSRRAAGRTLALGGRA
jgi:hypothetical protein